MHLILADSQLKGLVPDPSWDVQGVRDLVGGIVAVALVLCVGAIVIGVLSLMPGLVTNNAMEKAFSWKRLAAAILVPFVIGAAVSGWGWSQDVFGKGGLKANTSYSAGQDGKADSKGLKDRKDKGKDTLGDLVSQLGKDIAKSVGNAVKSALNPINRVKAAVKAIKDVGGKALKTVGNALSTFVDWLTGSDSGSGGSGSGNSGSKSKSGGR